MPPATCRPVREINVSRFIGSNSFMLTAAISGWSNAILSTDQRPLEIERQEISVSAGIRGTQQKPNNVQRGHHLHGASFISSRGNMKIYHELMAWLLIVGANNHPYGQRKSMFYTLQYAKPVWWSILYLPVKMRCPILEALLILHCDILFIKQTETGDNERIADTMVILLPN